MNYYIHGGEIYSQDELAHYGVVGMKWGVRRGNYSKAYGKAAKKAKKIEQKQYKYAKKAAKYDKKLGSWRTHKRYKKVLRYTRRKIKFEQKATKMELKGKKWIDQMENTFKDVKVSDIDKSVRDNGRKYLYMLDPDN